MEIPERSSVLSPSSAISSKLRLNITRNNFANVLVIEAAAGMENGTVQFDCGINGMVVQNGEGESVVQLKTLDSVVDEKVDLIKMSRVTRHRSYSEEKV